MNLQKTANGTARDESGNRRKDQANSMAGSGKFFRIVPAARDYCKINGNAVIVLCADADNCWSPTSELPLISTDPPAKTPVQYAPSPLKLWESVPSLRAEI